MCLSALVDVSSFCLFYSNCTISVYSFSANALKLMRRRCCCCCYCETYDHCVWCVVCSSGHQMVSAVVRLICSPRSVSGDSAKRAREWRQRKEDATANWWLVSLKRRAFNQSEQRHQTEETAHDDDDHDASRHFNITDSDVEQGKLYSFFPFSPSLSLSLMSPTMSPWNFHHTHHSAILAKLSFSDFFFPLFLSLKVLLWLLNFVVLLLATVNIFFTSWKLLKKPPREINWQ